MRVIPTELEGVSLIEPQVFADSRGFFLESWHAEKFAAAGLPGTFVQDNHSRSIRNTVRGLHYQVRTPQGKLVRCTSGEIFDVAVDLRPDSPTFGRWTGHLLTAENRRMMWVPPGFAHGFLALSDEADLLYKCTTIYSARDDRAIQWDDPRIGIRWPLPAGATPLLSPKDAAAPPLDRVDMRELDPRGHLTVPETAS